MLTYLRKMLLISIANHIGYHKIATGENSTHMAIQLLSSTSKGRGLSLPNEIANIEVIENLNIEVHRPMKDYLSEEVAYFWYRKKLPYVVIPTLAFFVPSSDYKSLNRVTETFLKELQFNFPSTIHTLVSAGSKIKLNKDSRYCPLCINVLDEDEDICYSCKILKNDIQLDEENEEFYTISRNLNRDRDSIAKEIEDSLLDD